MPLDKIQVESRDQDLNLDFIQIDIAPPTASSRAVDVVADFPYDIYGITVVTDAGTLDVQITIAGTPVSFDTDGTTVGVSSTIKTRDAASANSVAVGNSVLAVLSNIASSPAQLYLKLYIVRT